MPELTLGISPCPNDVYIFSGLILNQIETGGLTFAVDYQDVETLNGLAQRGARDIAKISYANAPRISEKYELLDCGGALGRGVGPLLLTNGADGWSPVRETLVPGAFTTANFLLDFYLRKNVAKRFLPFDALYDELRTTPGSQGVIIHEKRFTYAADGLSLVTDLGEHWERETGCAIPLGAIAVRRALHLTDALERLVRASLAWADTHAADAFALCRQHAQEMDDAVIAAHIHLYVNDFSRDLGDEGRRAVAAFFAAQPR